MAATTSENIYVKMLILTGFFLTGIHVRRMQGMGYYTVKNGSGFPVPAEMSLAVNNECILLASVLDVLPQTCHPLIA